MSRPAWRATNLVGIRFDTYEDALAWQEILRSRGLPAWAMSVDDLHTCHWEGAGFTALAAAVDQAATHGLAREDCLCREAPCHCGVEQLWGLLHSQPLEHRS